MHKYIDLTKHFPGGELLAMVMVCTAFFSDSASE